MAADEFSMAWTCRQSPSLITALYLSPRENNPPGSALVLHYWGKLFGYSDMSLRMCASMVCWIALVVLWLFVKEVVALFQMWTQTHRASVYLSSSEDEISAEHLPTISANVFLLAATTPVVWMSANFARYQSLVLLLSFAALYAYVRWLRCQQQGIKVLWLAGYAASIALMFYVHYLPAATLALSVGIHGVLWWIRRRRMLPRRVVVSWVSAQIGILVAIAPLVYWIILAYRTIDLSGGRSSQFMATPKFILALVYGIVNGFVVPFWWVWVFAPVIIAVSIVVWKLVSVRLLWRSDVVLIVALPVGFAAFVMAKMYPAETIFLIPAIQKIAYLAPLWWVVLGLALACFRKQYLQRVIIGTLILGNIYAIVVWNMNITAVQHTPPMREIASFIRSAGRSANSLLTPLHQPLRQTDATETLIVHSFLYFYGPLGMGKQEGAQTAINHHLPEYPSILLPETDVADTLSVEAARTFVPVTVRSVWIVQRNRFPHNAQTLTTVLKDSGFRVIAETVLQPQSSMDIWFKTQLLKRGIGGLSDEQPQPYLYTLRHLVRQ